MDSRISIRITPSVSIKMDEFILDVYSLHKYGKLFSTSKEKREKVLFDIKTLCKPYMATTTKEVKLLILGSIMPKENAKIFLEKYECCQYNAPHK